MPRRARRARAKVARQFRAQGDFPRSGATDARTTRTLAPTSTRRRTRLAERRGLRRPASVEQIKLTNEPKEKRNENETVKTLRESRLRRAGTAERRDDARRGGPLFRARRSNVRFRRRRRANAATSNEVQNAFPPRRLGRSFRRAGTLNRFAGAAFGGGR